MAEEVRLILFLLGCACFGYVVLIDGSTKKDQRIIACGWLLFALPFVWDTADKIF